MNTTPFIFGKTVSNIAFTDREDDSKKLYANLVGGVNTSIISPRRWGKSSLVEKVVSDICKNNKKTKVALIDLFSINSKEEFLEIYAKEVLKATSSRMDDILINLRDFFKHLSPKISFSSESDFSISFDWKDLDKHSDEILNLPEVIAQKKNINIIICLDEFQDLTSFSDYESFEKKLRAVWQRQKRVTYCLYGSKRHMMTNIFNNSSRPFYRFGDIIILQKIPSDKWIPFICSAFKRTEKKISKKNARLIASLMKNHSWYVQQLSHYVWNKTNKIVSDNEIRDGLEELILSSIPLFQKEIEAINPTQLNMLKAIADGENKLASQSSMIKYRIGSTGNVSKNKNILIQRDIINYDNETYEFLDPSLSYGLKNNFLAKITFY